MSMAVTTLVVCMACFSLYRAVREKGEERGNKLFPLALTRKKSAGKTRAKGLTSFVRNMPISALQIS